MIGINNDNEVYDFGIRLSKLRKSKGLTQKEVASRLEVHENTVGKYENNTRVPPVDKLTTLAVLYNSSVDYILGVDNRTNLYIDDLPENKQKLVLEIVNKIREDYEREKESQ